VESEQCAAELVPQAAQQPQLEQPPPETQHAPRAWVSQGLPKQAAPLQRADG